MTISDPQIVESHILSECSILRRWLGWMFLAVAMRLGVAWIGHNFDIDSWRITADLFLSGRSYWVDTYRWPYGPILPPILGAVRLVTGGWSHPEAFHIGVTLLLSGVDCAIAYLLLVNYGSGPAKLFLLNPVSVLITGYHAQVDNVAVLFGLSAMTLLQRRSSMTLWPVLASSLLFSLSLLSKHVLFLFPLWLFLHPRILGIGARWFWCVSCGAASLITLSACVAFSYRWEGFKAHVLEYHPTKHVETNGILGFLAEAVLNRNAFDGGAAPYLILFSSLAIVGIGACLSRFTSPAKDAYFFPIFLLVLFACSPALADQYLAIPVAAVCILNHRVFSSAFFLLATARLLVSPSNIGASLLYGASAVSWLPPPRPMWSLLGCALQGMLFLWLYSYFRGRSDIGHE